MDNCSTAEDVERIAAGVIRTAKDTGLGDASRFIKDAGVMAGLTFIITKLAKDNETLVKLVLVLAQQFQTLEAKVASEKELEKKAA